MKKKLIITESQYKRLINEQEDYTEQLLSLINSNDKTNLEMVKEIAPGQGINIVDFLKQNIKQIEKPFFYKFDILGIDEKEHKNILINYDDDISYIYDMSIYDKFKDEIYNENDTSWTEMEYDEDGNQVYLKTNIEYGDWEKRKIDGEGNEIFYESSDGSWVKYEYDYDGNVTYTEHNDGEWEKYEYDEYGNPIYYENSDGLIEDDREV